MRAQTGTWRVDGSGRETCAFEVAQRQDPGRLRVPGRRAARPGRSSRGSELSLDGQTRGEDASEGERALHQLSLQFQRHDPSMLHEQRQPIEDTSVEWREADSPFVPVPSSWIAARIRPPRKTSATSLRGTRHGLVDHRRSATSCGYVKRCSPRARNSATHGDGHSRQLRPRMEAIRLMRG